MLLFAGNSECQFYVWAILAFLVLALALSLIFNISHYVEKKRQGKTFWEITIWHLLEWRRLSHWKIYRRRQFYKMLSSWIFLSVENLFAMFFHPKDSLNLRMQVTALLARNLPLPLECTILSCLVTSLIPQSCNLP